MGKNNKNIEFDRIGVAGCGRMGAPMAQNLINAGFNVAGLDILEDRFFGKLAPIMTDAITFASGCRVVISVVRDKLQTEELLFSEQAIIRREPCSIHTIVICSTLSPRYLLGLRNRLPKSITLVDAPMSGASIAAEEGRLSFMLGGEKDVLNRLNPLFSAMGKYIHHVGPFSSGMTAKVLNNFCAATSIASTRIVLDWALELGIDRSALLAILNDSSGQNWVSSNFEELEFARDGYDPNNTIGIVAKDLLSLFENISREELEGLPNALLDEINNMRPMK